jgi:hypothetical protein
VLRVKTLAMTSLDDAYDRRWDGLGGPHRVGAGLVLVGVGALAVLAAMVLVALEPGTKGAKETAGIAAGLGVPAMLLGVVAVLRASRRNRLGVLAGAGLTVVGVALFWVAYPDRWTRTADPLAFETLAVYATGCAVGLWFVFSTLASTRLRNDPQGTVELEVVREGETRRVEVSTDRYQEIVGDGGDTEAVLAELGRADGDQSGGESESGPERGTDSDRSTAGTTRDEERDRRRGGTRASRRLQREDTDTDRL